MKRLQRLIPQLIVSVVLLAATARLARAQDPAEITPFKPFRVADNLYFVGTEGLGMFLVTTPKGHILVNSGYELNVRRLRQAIEYLGFRFSDVRILLASHAHGDHVGGMPLIKRMTGARYMVMDGDVPVVESGGAADFAYGNDTTMWYPAVKVDRILHDGDTVRLGDARLVAHRMPGHTRGATSWTMQVNDRGTMRNVLVLSSPNVNPEYRLVNNARYPLIADDYRRTFAVARSLPCEIFLAAHGAQFQLRAKFQRFAAGDSSAFMDPEGCRKWLADRERLFEAELAKQSAPATSNVHNERLATATSGSSPVRSGPLEINGRIVGRGAFQVSHISVFLDRGDAIVERYETDSSGVFHFPLWAWAPHRATWLACPAEALPVIGTTDRDEFSRPEPTVHLYSLTASTDSVYRFYRSRGWSGPIPRECPRGLDTVGWRYPASAGKDWGFYSVLEPDWARYPGPPALPKP